MLGQVNVAHAAFADLTYQFVLAEAEALVPSGQQLVGLPAREQSFFDQELGQARMIFEHGVAVASRGLFKKRGELRLVYEAATPYQVQQFVGGHLGHYLDKLRLMPRTVAT
jgi:hypothetical protein